MADASFIQTNFLGGEWSPLIQGRMDDPRYRSGLNVTRNVLPLEEGSAGRRPGLRLIGPTRKGAKGVIRAFDFKQSHPYNLELTAGHMRFLAGAGIVVESFGTQIVTAISAANPGVLSVPANHGWSTGDQVLVQIAPGQVNSTIAALLGRQLEITVTGVKTFSVADAVTGVAIDGTAMVLGSTDLTVTRIADFVTPYAEADLPAINQVQDQSNLLLLHPSYKPQAIISTSPEAGSTYAVFNINPAVFLDGPYFDPPKDGTTITSSGLSGSVTLTLAGGSTRFAATDVGRFVRLFSEPGAWSKVTAYAVGDQVSFNNEYYYALKASTGKQPDADVVNWGVATGAALWTWAIITAYTSATAVTATLQNPILRTTACATWRLGLFSDTTGYPACGTYHEGRLWLSGVVGNRLDGSVSNDFFNMAPTSPDGTVADNNAVAYVFNAKDVNQIYWMEPDGQGIICGTQAGEWLVSASASNDNLTATSVQAHRRTNYGCANVPPKRTGITITFVQRFQKKLLEYVTTDFRGLSAHNIALTGKHLTQKGLAEIAYQAEKVPTVWARTSDGALLSCTYKRESPYASDPPAFAGWARHDLGGGQTVESIQAGPNFDGTLDALTVVTSDGSKRWVQLITDLFDVDWTIGDSMFVDFAETPSMWEVIVGSPTVLRLYSLHYLAGKNVDVFAGGIDAGTLLVAADGHLDIPIDSATLPLLTSAWLASLTSTSNFHGLGLAITQVAPGTANVPTVTGIQNFDMSLIAARSDAGVDVDWDGNRLFLPDVANGKLLVLDTTTFKPILGPFNSTSFQLGLTYAEDGNLYGATLSTNCATLHRVNPKTGADTATFGVGTSSFATTATTWAGPSDFDTVAGSNGFTYLVSVCVNAAQTANEVTVLNLGNGPLVAPSWTGFSASLDEASNKAGVTRGKPVRNVARAHIMAWGHGSLVPNSTSIGVYTLSIAGLASCSLFKVGVIAPSALGTGWTHISGLQGILLDETDGNIIAHVVENPVSAYSGITSYSIGDLASASGHDFKQLQNSSVGNAPTIGGTAFWADLGVSGPTEVRIVKVNVHTAAVMWSNVIVNSIPGFGRLNSTRIRNGRYNYVDTSSPNCIHRSINTITGVMTSSGLLSILLGGYQFSNDFTGNVFFNAQYAASGVVPIGTTPSSFNSWATLGPAAGPAVPAAIPPANGVFWTTPVAIGYAYPSQGQILRAIAPQEAGAQNGPALGKTRRTHMYSALLQKAQGVSFGTDFSATRPAQLRSKGGIPLPLTTLFSGVHQDSLQDDYSFDSMLCWQITRPYPATVCTLGAFLHTQDR